MCKTTTLKKTKMVFKTYYHLMQVKSIAECFIKLPLVIKTFFVYFLSDRLTQVLLVVKSSEDTKNHIAKQGSNIKHAHNGSNSNESIRRSTGGQGTGVLIPSKKPHSNTGLDLLNIKKGTNERPS